MKISSFSSKLVLEFDGSSPEVSEYRVRILATILSGVADVSSVQLTWYATPKIIATHSARNVAGFLRQVAEAFRSPQIDLTAIPATPLPEIPIMNIFGPGGVMLEHRLELLAESLAVTLNRIVRQVFFGGLACGSFFMAWVGVLVPGIPTIPFVILTVYFAEKASPTLRGYFLRSPLLGPAMRDWHEHRAIRRSSQLQALAFTGLLVVISLAIATPSTGLYIGIAIMSSLGVYLILSLPVIDRITDETARNESAIEDSRAMTLPMRFAGA
ncbi:MAG: hypothetical protein JWN70_3196 [Planctomycetaceae bacterium]|nr:hypothetical protein [Planctomycetaceae bacterium]